MQNRVTGRQAKLLRVLHYIGKPVSFRALQHEYGFGRNLINILIGKRMVAAKPGLFRDYLLIIAPAGIAAISPDVETEESKQ